ESRVLLNRHRFQSDTITRRIPTNMDVQAIDQTQATAQAAVAAAGQAGQLPPFPTPPAPGEKPPQPTIGDGTLHNALSQLVGSGSHVSVQFLVVGQNEIVTGFKKAETGEMINQFR